MLTMRYMEPSTWTERFFASPMRTSSVLCFILLHIDSGREFLLMKLGPDPLSGIVENLLVNVLENPILADTL